MIVDDSAFDTAIDAERHAHRYRNSLSALTVKLDEAVAREKAAAWRYDANDVENKRNELSAELRETYPKMVETLVDLFQRIALLDTEIQRVNTAAPPGVDRRLSTVEATARGIEGLGWL